MQDDSRSENEISFEGVDVDKKPIVQSRSFQTGIFISLEPILKQMLSSQRYQSSAQRKYFFF